MDGQKNEFSANAKSVQRMTCFIFNIHFLNNVNNVHSRTVRVDIGGLGPCRVNLREKYSNGLESSGGFFVCLGGGGSTGPCHLLMPDETYLKFTQKKLP